MAVNLVTGYAGKGHVTAADAGRFNAGVCGAGKYVLNTGSMFAYSLNSNNKITIASGDLINQGRHVSIPENENVEIDIQNGSQGKKRIDVISMRYTKDSSSGIESADIVILKGTEVNVGSTATPAKITSGNIFEGELVDDFPLYQITIENLSVIDVKAVFKMLTSIDQIVDKIHPVGSVYMSFDSTNPASLFGGTWEMITGKFLMGAASGEAGRTGGAESVQLSANNLAPHIHELQKHTHVIPDHTHSIPSHTHTATCSTTGEHQHGVDRNKVCASGTSKYAAQYVSADSRTKTTKDGSHSHTITIKDKATFNTTSSGQCTSEGGGNGYTEKTGMAVPFEILPPYITVYMWRRTK